MLTTLLGPPRSSAFAPAVSFDSTAQWSMLSARKTNAGPVVDPEIALTYAAVWCATRVIAETAAMLPLPLYRRTEDGGREVASEHRVHKLFKMAPNPTMTPMPFREGRTQHQVNWGNGFAEIERDRNSKPLSLWPIHPSRVIPITKELRGNDGELYVPGDYGVRNNDGTTALVHRADMIHIPGCLSDDGIWGKGTIAYHRETIGHGMATERHGAEFFGSGGQPLGILIVPGMMKDKDARTALRKEWKEIHSPASGGKSGEVAILPQGTEYKAISLSNEDAQFIDSRKLNRNQIATIYRLPPHMLSDLERATFSNIEHLGIGFVQYSLMPWLVREAQEYNAKLLTPAEQEEYYLEHNVDALLRGDYYTRMQGNEKAILSGQVTLNEVRRRENLPSIGPAGDQHYVPLNYTTAERMMEEPPEPKPAAGQQPDTESPEEDAGETEPADGMKSDTENDAAKVFLSDTLARLFAKEANAVRRKAFNADTDFDAWLVEFHGGHVETLTEALRTPARLTGHVPDALAMGVVGRSGKILLEAYNSQTKPQMAELLDTWSDTRTAAEMAILYPEQK